MGEARNNLRKTDFDWANLKLSPRLRSMHNLAITASFAAIALLVSACNPPEPPKPIDPVIGPDPIESDLAERDAFFGNIMELCGHAYGGRVVSTDASDKDFAEADLILHVRDCSNDEIRMPFHVADNRSRTFLLSKTETGLRLRHDHRHEDGSEDAITLYGGKTANSGTSFRQEFPADDYSKELFLREGLDVSVANIWAMEVHPDDFFAYELRRPNRFFRVEFDLSNPVPPPPPTWGAQPVATP